MEILYTTNNEHSNTLMITFLLVKKLKEMIKLVITENKLKCEYTNNVNLSMLELVSKKEKEKK